MVDLSNLGLSIDCSLAPTPPARLPPGPLGFGKLLTDHVFLAEHTAEQGWGEFAIRPRNQAGVDLASGALQYGLSIFEGLKAYRTSAGQFHLFRPDRHARRFAQSAQRLCMPPIETGRLVAALRALTRVEQDSIPEVDRGSLYLRPVLFASDEYLGVRPGSRHTLAVLGSPVDSYFGQDARPLRLWAERELTRAAPGGLGAVKTGGNYAASLLAAQRAKQRGYDQVLWLDAVEHRYLEEVGTMNLFVHLKSAGVVTPPADGTILEGVTRDCCLTLLREWGIPSEERRLTLDDLQRASAEGDLLEIFGTGTAAVIAEVGEVAWDEGRVQPTGGPLGLRLKETLTALHRGEARDTRGWLTAI
jgi:branched-chain amino acid aminotransferase